MKETNKVKKELNITPIIILLIILLIILCIFLISGKKKTQPKFYFKDEKLEESCIKFIGQKAFNVIKQQINEIILKDKKNLVNYLEAFLKIKKKYQLPPTTEIDVFLKLFFNEILQFNLTYVQQLNFNKLNMEEFSHCTQGDIKEFIVFIMLLCDKEPACNKIEILDDIILFSKYTPWLQKLKEG